MKLFIIAYLIFSAWVFLKVINPYSPWDGMLNKRNTGSGEDRLIQAITLNLSLIAFVIPFFRVATSIPSILLLLLVILYFIRHGSLQQFKTIFSEHLRSYAFFLVVLLLFIVIHSFFIPGDYTKLSLYFLPLLYLLAFQLIAQFDTKASQRIARSFMWGCALFAPFILGIASFRYGDLSWNAFYYTDLLDPVKANPITHALYFNVALILNAQWYKQTSVRSERFLAIGLMVLNLGMLILFGSKIGYLTAMLSVFFLGLSLLPSWFYRLVFVVLAPLLVYFIFLQVPYVNKKIKGFKWQLSRHDVISLDNRLPRSIIWPEAVKLVQAKPFSGYGLGKGYEELAKSYETIGYTKGINNRFNAHNQFLESGIQWGLFGVLWWVILLLYLLNVARKKKDPWLANFVILLGAFLMVESLMESQMGSVAFGFLLLLFLGKSSTSHYLK